MSESKIEKFDRAACGTVGDEAMQALAEVAEKYGLTLVRERGSFDHGGGSFTFKASFKVMTESGQPAREDLAPRGRSPPRWFSQRQRVLPPSGPAGGRHVPPRR